MTTGTAAALPPALADAVADQPGVAAALGAALASPSHAYLFTGPAGAGKSAAARAFAAELLADGAPDPESARRRVLADPSPHPDLAWLRPPGAQHLVEEVRERVIEAAPYRPFEGERRAFVVERADAMAEESQNALLKTLEEPAGHAILILVTSQPSALLETVRSRCQPIAFTALSPEAVEERLGERNPGADPLERRAAARLAGGDLARAELLLSDGGRELRRAAEAYVRAARSGALQATPWTRLLEVAGERGEDAGGVAREHLESLAAQAGDAGDRRAEQRLRKEADDAAKRATRRGRTDALDTALGLAVAWLRDLAATADGASELALAADRAAELAADADGLDARRARRAAELVMDTRRRLTVNVSEELAVEALAFRLEVVLRS
jgi:DNA polymerase III subunit delta'